MDHEIGILKKFAALKDQQQRRRVVKMYHHGHVDILYGDGHVERKQAYSMELGEQTLDAYFKNNGAELNAADGIKKVATDIALAMRDFHTGTIGA
jgi:prepilin-type processing-associated H-X9-DG protein